MSVDGIDGDMGGNHASDDNSATDIHNSSLSFLVTQNMKKQYSRKRYVEDSLNKLICPEIILRIADS